MTVVEGLPATAELTEEQTQEMDRLRRRALTVAVAQVALAIAAAVGMVALIDEPRTDNMQELAVIGALAGLVGGSMQGLFDLVSTASVGLVLGDGTTVLRGRHAAWQAQELRAWERDEAARASRPDAAGRAAPRPEPSTFGALSASDMPVLIVAPLIGAVFGLIVFAGVVGGFLVASTETGTYSAPALIFVAFLGGFFSNKFFERLAAAADALFGTQENKLGANASNQPRGEQQR